MGPEVGGGNPFILPNVLRQQSGPWQNMHWRVPIDDRHTNIIVMNSRRNADGHPEEQPEFPPVEFTAEVLPNGEYAMDSFFGQDKMALGDAGCLIVPGRTSAPPTMASRWYAKCCWNRSAGAGRR